MLGSMPKRKEEIGQGKLETEGRSNAITIPIKSKPAAFKRRARSRDDDENAETQDRRQIDHNPAAYEGHRGMIKIGGIRPIRQIASRR